MPVLINTKKCTSAQICTAFESYLAIFGQTAQKRCANGGQWTPDTYHTPCRGSMSWKLSPDYNSLQYCQLPFVASSRDHCWHFASALEVVPLHVLSPLRVHSLDLISLPTTLAVTTTPHYIPLPLLVQVNSRMLPQLQVKHSLNPLMALTLVGIIASPTIRLPLLVVPLQVLSPLRVIV
jgi:hypothetical protein